MESSLRHMAVVKTEMTTTSGCRCHVAPAMCYGQRHLTHDHVEARLQVDRPITWLSPSMWSLALRAMS